MPTAVTGRILAGRYRLISELGVGGMGVTYRAWDDVNAVPVVVKMPKREAQSDEEALRRFAREIDAMLAVNVKGSIVLVRECVRQMLIHRDGVASRHPSIALISSVVAERGSPGLSVYAATKAALEGFGISLARELGPRGIRVNIVAPGFLETDLSAPLSPENRERIARRTALGQLGTAADVVGTVLFLTTGASGFLTGQVIAADGGA
jgi:3-oxoacyl-[acyl-carrier protein] reductase